MVRAALLTRIPALPDANTIGRLGRRSGRRAAERILSRQPQPRRRERFARQMAVRDPFGRYAPLMSEAGPEVPAEIEDYLIGLSARAGQIGGAIGSVAAGSIAGPGAAAAGGRGGARGGARGAARLKTKVELRAGDVAGTAEQVASRLTAAFPKAKPLAAGDHLRLAVPLGVTGLQQIVIDVEFGLDDGSRVPVRLRGFGKEGVINRKPTRTITDQAWAAITAAR
jgi:hypothetical protein